MIEFRKDNTYLVNLDKCTDRLESVTNELNKLNIQFTRFSAISPTTEQIKSDPIWSNSYQNLNYKKIKKFKNYLNGAMGCKMSHYNIIKLAEKLDLEYVIIFEDDILLNNNAEEIYNEVKNIELEDWDIIYLGGQTVGKKYEKVGKYIQQIYSSYSTMGYIVNKRAYDIISKNFISQKVESDEVLKNLSSNNKIRIFHCEMIKHSNKPSCIRK